MRLSIVALLGALISSTSASLVSRQLPNCAQQCLMTADFGNCQPTDNACLCRSNQFLTSSTVCIGQACTGSDLQEALKAAQDICAVVGVTLTSTPSGFPTGAATGTAPAASTTGSGSGTTSAGASTPTSSGNAASVNGVNALAGMAALGMAALVL